VPVNNNNKITFRNVKGL